MKPVTYFQQDILRQPSELRLMLDLFAGPVWDRARQAAALVRQSHHVFLTGIGASWNAAMGAGALFSRQGCSVCMLEAGELLHFTAIPSDSLVNVLSPTGRSIEIVRLLAKAHDAAPADISGPTSPGTYQSFTLNWGMMQG